MHSQANKIAYQLAKDGALHAKQTCPIQNVPQYWAWKISNLEEKETSEMVQDILNKCQIQI